MCASTMEGMELKLHAFLIFHGTRGIGNKSVCFYKMWRLYLDACIVLTLRHCAAIKLMLNVCACLRSVFCVIAEAQPQTPVKDKSPWRKSNLNVPNSAEETELDMRRLRRMQSRGSVDAGSASSNPLQVYSYCEMLLLQMQLLWNLCNKLWWPFIISKFYKTCSMHGGTKRICRKFGKLQRNRPQFDEQVREWN